MIDRLRRDRGLRWVVSTGRHYGSFHAYTGSLRRANIHADIVITAFGRVFRYMSGKGYRFLPGCTARVVTAYVLGRVGTRRRLRLMHRHLCSNVKGVRRVLRLPDRFALGFSSQESTEEAVRWVKTQIGANPGLRVTQLDRQIEVVQVDARKGYGVRALAQWLGISRDEILVIGDSSSDSSMLNRRIALYTGCPLNADENTMQAVHDMGGHISRKFTLAGVMDVLQACHNGTMSSEIPPEREDMPSRRRSRTHHSRQRTRERKQLLRSYLLAGAIAGITLVVFASFGLVPFSGLIMKPVYLLFRVIDWVWSLF